jgi:hypothetical protein
MEFTNKQLDLLISWGRFVKFNDVSTEEDGELFKMIMNKRYNISDIDDGLLAVPSNLSPEEKEVSDKETVEFIEQYKQHKIK